MNANVKPTVKFCRNAVAAALSLIVVLAVSAPGRELPRLRVSENQRFLVPGWQHLTAVRRSDRLKLYVNGRLAATSSAFAPADYDLTTDSPLRIGFGEVDYFSGRIREVRLYGRALTNDEISRLAADKP